MQNKFTFYIILAVEILTVILTSVGIVEREAVLIMTGVMIFYFIFSKIEDSLILFIISIPLFIALSISENFDSMANWRILLAILFLRLFFEKGLSIKTMKDKLGQWKIKEKFKHYLMEYLVVLFLIIAVLSIFVAADKVVGIKKILFLVNIFLLYIIIRNVIFTNPEMRSKIIKSGAIAGIISLIIGYGQLILIFFKPLYTFWQWWADKVIPAFYGHELGKLLSVSNTWFSYYPDKNPTLRMFSVFPDSHSFALFVIIGLIFFVYLLKEKKSFWVPIILSFLAIIFSGSRAIWVSALVPFFGIIILAIFKNKTKIKEHSAPFAKKFIIMLIIFILAFPASSLIYSFSYQGGDGDTLLAFKRAKTIIDIDELSVKSRMGIWKASFQSILKHPILGVGIGNYPVVLNEDISAAKKGASAHNLYLDVASEMGILGLIVLLMIFFEIFKLCWKKFKEDKYILVFFFFLVWILIYNLFDVVLLNDKVLLLFMVAMALVYPIENHEKSISIS